MSSKHKQGTESRSMVYRRARWLLEKTGKRTGAEDESRQVGWKLLRGHANYSVGDVESAGA